MEDLLGSLALAAATLTALCGGPGVWSAVSALSDLGIFGAYAAIPFLFVAFVRKRWHDLYAYRPALLWVAAFVLLCGLTHFVHAAMPWLGAGWAPALAALKLVTAAVSIRTAFLLGPLLRQALDLPSPQAMRDSNVALAASNRALNEREAELRALGERDRAAFARSPVAGHILDGEGRILDVSDLWLEMMGRERHEVIGRPIAHFHADDQGGAAGLGDAWARLLAEGELRNQERRFVRGDGAAVEAVLSGRVERPEDGRGPWVICSVVDVTAQRRAERERETAAAALHDSEERLRQAQKMEAIGQLTGGIAHDFNNMLQVITGNAQLARRKLEKDRPDLGKAARMLDAVQDACGKAALLTIQLLAFARRQRLDPQPVDPVTAVRDMMAMARSSAGDRIVVEEDVARGVGICLADKAQLQQAVINLVINARDAIYGSGRGTGTITVAMRAVDLPGKIDPGQPAPGPYVKITVCDDGPGMPEEVLRRAFEPFFTTKPLGQGTGLGLSTVHGFAHQSGGWATIESARGEGTKVSIYLPRLGDRVCPTTRAVTDCAAPCPQGPGAAPGASPPLAEAQRTQAARVLVVEDEALVRATLADTLLDLGYEVEEAASGPEALEFLKARQGSAGVRVDAVLTDLAMPGEIDGVGFDGLELLWEASRRWPGLPLVMMTGNPAPPQGNQLPPGTGFLAKPYQRGDVIGLLRQVLARARETA